MLDLPLVSMEIVDGTVRDPEQYRGMGWPVWCRGFTPITGKWSMQTVEVNGTVQICGIPVKAGDIVCADDAGVAFLPRERAAAVLELCRKIDDADTRRKADIDAGVSVAELHPEEVQIATAAAHGLSRCGNGL
jgi:4-hydroxy-4-methyl-2-oxoglutarate aldolase